MPKQLLKPDFCVIGGGPGGLSFAAGAAQMGASVVLLERRKMGGDCLNYGCVPSKALIAAARIGTLIDKSRAFGWECATKSVNYQNVYKHVHEVIQSIAPHDSVDRYEKLGVKVILEEGHFVDTGTVATPSFQVRARRFILATGSSPFVPPISGLQDVSFYTNETLFDLKECPQHLIIIGGGPIGIEMAQAFRRFGAKVSVLEAFKILPKDDPELAAMLREVLVAEGVCLYEETKVLKVGRAGDRIRVFYENGFVEGSHLLVAVGRKAVVDGLNLDAAGVRHTPRGVVVDKHLRTSNSRVWAIGDCIGDYQFTHVANYHAGIVLRNTIFRMRACVKTTAIPWVTYTDPELAHVGATQGPKIVEGLFQDNDRAQAERTTMGKIKVITSRRGYILGVTILGPHAGELILPWVLAINEGLKLKTLANMIVPYPTLSEVSKQVATAFFKDKLFSPWMRRLVRFLLWWTK